MLDATSRDALRRSGWSDARIRSAMRRGDLVATTRGVLLPGAVADEHAARCAAALAGQHPAAAVSHRSAAVLHAFRWLPPTWSLSTEPIDLTAPREDLTRSSRRGLRRRLAAVPHDDVVVCHGLRVTSPARTLVDLARTEPRLLAVQIADGALTDGQCSPDALLQVCDRMVRVPNVTRARAMARLARVGVDSPAETTARLHIVDAGLPEPDVRLELHEDERLLAAGDLGYWRWLIWIEYDGFDVHGARTAFGSDRFRDRWLTRRGWEPMRLYGGDLARPGGFLRQLDASIREAPARIAALDPRRSPEVAAAQALLARS
jgi:hypothetical protein